MTTPQGAKLRPVTGSVPSGRIPRIEGARAIAAFMVLVTHTGDAVGAIHPGVVGAFLARADWGVALFFVLSGFLLSRGWVRAVQGDRQRPSLRRYAKHRLARILPAYWLTLIAVVLTVGRDATGATIASNVALVQVYNGLFLPDFFQTWSLCTEVAFYAVLPLLAPLVIRRSVRKTLVLLTLMAAVSPVWIYLIKGPLAQSVLGIEVIWLPGHLDWFCVGMGLAVCERAIRSGSLPLGVLERQPSLLLAVAAFGYAIAMTPLAGPLTISQPITPTQTIAKELLYAAIALLAMVALLLPKATSTPWGRALDSRVMQWAGRVSYAFFLWHPLMLTAAMLLLGVQLGSGRFLSVLILTTGLTLAVSQLSWWLLEKPVLRAAGASTK